MTPDRVHWWQVYATVKWATICALQASAHLSGATRSVELAAIGRRVCESEWDLFTLLGTPPPADRRTRPGGRTDAALRPARPRPSSSRRCASTSMRSWSAARTAPASRPVWRATRWASPSANCCSVPAFAAAHAERLADLGFGDDAALAAALRSGALDGEWEAVAPALAASARDQLLVANPAYLPAASG